MKKRVVYPLVIISFIVLLDQITKYLARTFIHPMETIELLPVLNLVSVRNQGAAFGMFSSLGNNFFICISVAAILFMLWVIITSREDYRIFSMLAAGAIGNLIDRLTLGYVVDFMDVTVSGHHWPAFNVADSALTIGIAFLLFNLIIKRN
ncbi:MAG: signal peptidase II [Nitrospira bacterium HGW-Nitrospira-1]|nr:MAG: signal peptidase II [Nitrospira bacterium HGW-Nitrospira-1]